MEISSDENGDGNGNLPLERTNTATIRPLQQLVCNLLACRARTILSMTMTQNINDSLSGSCRCVICNLPATPSARILKACNTVDPDFPQIYCCDNIANIAPATNIGKILLNSPPSINWFKARATSGCDLFITSSRSFDQCHQ